MLISAELTFAHYKMTVELQNESSRDWAIENRDRLQSLIDLFSAHWTGQPVLLHFDPNRRNSIGSIGRHFASALREAFPRDKFEIGVRFRETVPSEVERYARL